MRISSASLGIAVPLAGVLCVAAACASAPAASAPAAPAAGAVARPRPAVAPDTASAGLLPVGFGTLRQDEIAIRLSLPEVQLKLIPLDEQVLRVLTADSYRALRGVLESRSAELDRLATLHGLRERQVWYATFVGLSPDARFTPTDVTVTSSGREFRPLEILPLTSGFGAQRLQPRETQAALLLFDDGLDVTHPVTVAAGTERSEQWSEILRTIERERALIRGRSRNGGP